MMDAPMMHGHDRDSIIAALPAARRFARALIGSRAQGDALVADALQSLPEAANAREALYARLAALAPHDDAALLPRTARLMLLLTSVEELPPDDAARVLDLSPEHGAAALATARAQLKQAAATDVMIIEDEAIIALDLEALVERAGHRVVGIAASEAEAVALAERTRPGLILADVNLGRGGNGSAAVARILERMSVPVVFVTAYPEQLLSGRGIEPTWVLTKPFDPTTLAVTTFEAAAGRKLRP
jgi:CheY-like chemotaxis protein